MGTFPYPDIVHTQERNDCGICAVQYVARLMGIPDDREAIKACPEWSSEHGGLPLSYLHQHGLKTPGWICEGLEWHEDPEHPGVRIYPASEHNINTLWLAYREQMELNRPGIVTWMIPAGPHAEVILGAYEHEGTKMVLAADSLDGFKDWPAKYAFTAADGGLRGKDVTWVVKP